MNFLQFSIYLYISIELLCYLPIGLDDVKILLIFLSFFLYFSLQLQYLFFIQIMSFFILKYLGFKLTKRLSLLKFFSLIYLNIPLQQLNLLLQLSPLNIHACSFLLNLDDLSLNSLPNTINLVLILVHSIQKLVVFITLLS